MRAISRDNFNIVSHELAYIGINLDRYFEISPTDDIATTHSVRIFKDTNIRHYISSVYYTSPIHENAKIYICYYMKENPPLVAFIEKANGKSVLCDIQLPSRDRFLSDEDYIAKIENKLSLIAHKMYVLDCIESEKTKNTELQRRDKISKT